VRVFPPGSHHGILLIRLAVPDRRRLESYLRALFVAEDLRQWTRCLVVAMTNALCAWPGGLVVASLDLGAKIARKKKDGATALDVAVSRHQGPIAELLMDLGSPFGSQVLEVGGVLVGDRVELEIEVEVVKAAAEKAA